MTDQLGQKARELIEKAYRHRSACRFAEAAAGLDAAVKGPGGENLTTYDRAALLRELAEIRLAQGAWQRAHEHLDDALVLLGGTEARHDHPELWSAVMERKAFALFREGRLTDARSVAQMITEAPERRLASAFNTLAGIAWQQGRLQEAIEAMHRAVNLYESAGDTVGAAVARSNEGILLFTSGRWQEAEKQFEDAEERLRSQTEWTVDRARNLVNLGILESAKGKHGEARKHLDEGLRLGRTLHQEYVAARAEIALAHLDVIESRSDEALRRLDSIDSTECLCDDDRVQAAWLKALVECDRNQVGRGVELAERARKIAHDAQLVESEADCCRALGVAHRRSSKNSDSERLLLESIALAERAGDPYRRALALLELGALRQEGSLAGAREPLDEATKLFQELGARHDLSRAQTISRNLH